MNNTDIIVQDTSRKDIERCHCPKCKGCAGTARVCFNSRKLASRAWGNKLAQTAGLLLFLCCFFTAPAVEATPSGQDEKAFPGFLKVYSSTQQSQWGDGGYYYLHTGYRIYDSTGTVVRWVQNHDSNTDEDPEKVELPPGKYTIRAQSDKDGYVKVPVIIKLARTTVVQLENDRAGIAGHL